MELQELKSKFFSAIEQNQAGELSAFDTEKVLRHIFETVQEESDALIDFNQKSDAHLVRFEMQQTLRAFGIDTQY